MAISDSVFIGIDRITDTYYLCLSLAVNSCHIYRSFQSSKSLSMSFKHCEMDRSMCVIWIG